MSHKWMDQDKRKALSALGTGAQGTYTKSHNNENHHYHVVPPQCVLTDGWLYHATCHFFLLKIGILILLRFQM